MTYLEVDTKYRSFNEALNLTEIDKKKKLRTKNN